MKSEPKAFASLSSGLLARKGSARPAMRPQGFGQGGGNLEDLGWNDMGQEAPRPTLMPVDGSDFGHAEPQVSRTPLAGLTPISPVHDQQAELEERLGYHDEAEEGFEGEEQAYEAYSDSYEDQAEEAGAVVEALELDNELPEAMPMPACEPMPVASVVPLRRSMPEQDLEIAPEPASRSTPKRSKAARSRESAKEKAAFTLRLDPSRHLKLRLACAVNAKSAQQLVTSALDKLLASMPELDAMASKAPGKTDRKG